jgi:hypothetical protein
MDLVTLTTGPVVTGNTVNADSPSIISGRIVGVYVEPVIGCLTDAVKVTITAEPGELMVLEATIEEPAWYFPTIGANANTNGAAIANEYVHGIPVHGRVNVAIDDAEVDDYANVYMVLE